MRIEARYCGPPDSGHGGVSAGRFAELVDGGPVEVRLLGPPPLDTDLDTRIDGDGVVTVSGPGGDVARVRALDQPLGLEDFSLVSNAELDEAEAEALRGMTEKGHPFPTCFGCGPERGEGDGLRQFAGPAEGGDTVVARFFVAGEGELPGWMVWAGLDCPSGFAAGALSAGPGTALVLGTMSAQVLAPARAGVEYQVRGRLLAAEGRKKTSEVTMLDPDGEAVGVARAVWIEVDPATF
jgi:hypothetical protein